MLLKSKNMLLATLIFLCVSSAISGQIEKKAHEADFTLNDMIEGIKMRKEMLKGVHIKFEYARYNGLTKRKGDDKDQFRGIDCTVIWKIELHRLDDKMRVNRVQYFTRRDANPFHRDLFTWNGLKMMGMGFEPENPDKIIGGTVQAGKNMNFELFHWQTPVEHEIFRYNNTLPELLEMGRWKLTGPENVGDYDKAYKLEGRHFFSEDDSDVLEVWIDPLRDFAPVKMRHNVPKKTSKIAFPAIYELNDIKLEQRNGVWIITEALYSYENLEEEMKKKYENPICFCKFKVAEYEIDPDLDESLFIIDYPRGTEVYDSIIETSYVVGEGIYLRNESGRMGYVKLHDFDVSNPRDILELEEKPGDFQFISPDKQAERDTAVIKDIPGNEIASGVIGQNVDTTESSNKIIIIILGSLFLFLAGMYLYIRYSRGRANGH